jgi:beta-phosphoglucomutase
MKGICFDFNGVIVDDERHHCAALLQVLKNWGITVDEATYYRDYLGFDDRGCFMHAWSQAGWTLDTATITRLIAEKGKRYQALITADLTLVPGSAEFIRTLHAQGVRMAVVSAALRDEIVHVLRVADLEECFIGIVAAEDVTATKPNPEGYKKGHALLGIPAASCLVIEDSIPGCRAGRAAGMDVVMLATSHSRGELAGADAALIWDDFRGHHPEELPWHSTSS